MFKFRLAHLGLIMAALSVTAVSPLIGLSSAAYAAETVRAEVGGPLTAAQAMMKSGRNKEALAELRKADNVGGKSAFESYQIERVRAAAASAAGDTDTAARAFEAIISSGRVSEGEKIKFLEGLVGIYMRAHDNAKAISAINRSLKEHDDPKMRAYLVQTYYAMGNYAQATRELQTSLRGGTPSEDQLQMLANLNLRSKNTTGYVEAIERLAAYYPKQSYWQDLLNRVSGKTGFSGRLLVDVYRLKLATNVLKAGEYLELGQLTLSERAPAETVKIIEKGYKAGLLGTGTDAPRHQRLKDLATKTLDESNKTLGATETALLKEKDNDGLLALGYELVQAGEATKGLAMMEAALKADNLKHPDTAKLHLGMAYAVAGKKSQALSTLKSISVNGTEGTADLARYWIMLINHPMG